MKLLLKMFKICLEALVKFTVVFLAMQVLMQVLFYEREPIGSEEETSDDITQFRETTTVDKHIEKDVEQTSTDFKWSEYPGVSTTGDLTGTTTNINEVTKINVLGSNADSCPNNLLGQPSSIRSIPDCPDCEAITCKKLLFSKFGDPVYNSSRLLMQRHAPHFNAMTDDQLLGLSKDCGSFKRVRGYHLESSDEEIAFPIAFTILAHQNLVQTEKLLRVIYRPHNVYCIHIDLKSKSLLDDMSHIVKCFDNVFVASKLENVVYAGFSRLQADINCLHDLLSSEVKWKYLLNTAATAFPLKTNLELVRTLKAYNGSNDIKTIKTIDNDYLQSRFKFRHEEKNGHLHKTNVFHQPPPHNLTIVKGNAYAVFSRDFMEFVVKDQRVKDFLEWCRHTMTPDEHFWHTLHSTFANPHISAPGGFSGVYNKHSLAVFVSWSYEGHKCQGKNVHSICVYGVGDLPKLMEPETLHYNFANKFFLDFEPLTLECLENWIDYKVACPPEFDYEFYRRLPFSQKTSNV